MSAFYVSDIPLDTVDKEKPQVVFALEIVLHFSGIPTIIPWLNNDKYCLPPMVAITIPSLVLFYKSEKVKQSSVWL